AISGWLMGSGEAIDNLETSLSLRTARDVAKKYMAATRKPDRDNLIAQFPSEVNIDYIAKIIAHMKPPLETAIIPPAGGGGRQAAAVLGLQAEGKKSAGEKAAEPNVVAPKTGDSKVTDKKNDDDAGSCAPKDKDDDSALLKTVPKPVVITPKE